jgi:hypothetical protein
MIVIENLRNRFSRIFRGMISLKLFFTGLNGNRRSNDYE